MSQGQGAESGTWLRSGTERNEGDNKVRSDSTAAGSRIELGPEALRMKRLGESMDLSDFELAQLVSQGAKLDRELELKNRELEEKKRDRDVSIRLEAERSEREEAKWQHLLARDAAERDREQRASLEQMKELLTELRPIKNPTAESFRVKLEPFSDRDDIDQFIEHFETVATAHAWPKGVWALRLLPLLQGASREVIKDIPAEDIKDYDKVKKALFFRFRKTAEHFRRAFRKYRRKESETFAQAGEKCVNFARKWMRMMDKDPDDVNDVWDCFMQEAAFSLLGGGELEVKVREREPETYQEVLESADVIFEAKRVSLPARIPGQGASETLDRVRQNDKHQHRSRDQRHRSQVNGSAFRQDARGDGCYKCGSLSHQLRNCPERKVKVGFVGVGLQPEVRLDLCRNRSEKEFDPVVKALVNGKEVVALRDTGASTVVVSAELVKEEDLTGRWTTVTLADSRIEKRAATAIVTVRSAFLQGRVEAVVLDHASYDLIIGNTVLFDDGSAFKVPVFPEKTEAVQAVMTRSRAKREEEEKTTVPVQQTTGLGVSPSELQKMQGDDTSLSQAMRAAAEGRIFQTGQHQFRFVKKNGLLEREYRGDRGTRHQICVPYSLRSEVMRLAHDAPLAGHLAAKRTRERIWSDFYWPGMCQDIVRYVRSCDRCQKVSPKGRVKKVPLGKLPLMSEPFQRVAVDLVGPVSPASEDGHRYILVMVDYATRYPEAVALKSIDTITVAEALLSMWSRVGIPERVLSDRGTQFVSEIMKEVHRLLSIEGLKTTPYHAQGNGLVERFNATLKAMIKKLCVEKPKTWHRFLPAVLFAYREVPQASTGYSPFELLYGRTVRGPMAILRAAWTQEEADEDTRTTYQYVLDLKNRLEETCRLARDSLKRAGEAQKAYFDKSSKQRVFKPGDKVLLLRPTKSNKLEMEWRGPYEVESRYNGCDYWIKIGGEKKDFPC